MTSRTRYRGSLAAIDNPSGTPDQVRPASVFYAGQMPGTGGTNSNSPYVEYGWVSVQSAQLYVNDYTTGKHECVIGNGSSESSTASSNTHLKISSTQGLSLTSGHIAVRFDVQLRNLHATNFTAFEWGSFATLTDTTHGILRIEYVYDPTAAYHLTHTFKASLITRDPNASPSNKTSSAELVKLECSGYLTHTDVLVAMYLEYDGSELNFICDQTSATDATSSPIQILSSEVELSYGADYPGVYFNSLQIFDKVFFVAEPEDPTDFPYMRWDDTNSGVIAVLHTASLATPEVGQPDPFFTFIDTGLPAGHQPATFQLAGDNTAAVDCTVYINEQPHKLVSASSHNVLDFLAGGYRLNIDHDGATHTIYMESAAGAVKAWNLTNEAKPGQLSFSIRLEGGTHSPSGWGSTMPIIGKVPQHFYLPHTGEPNRGISLMGANKAISTPTALTVQRKDDLVQTVGAVIGSVTNRPAAVPSITTLIPKSFFGSDRAVFPRLGTILGAPNTLSTIRAADATCNYGVYWESEIASSMLPGVLRLAPHNHPRAGDCFMAFSVDIPARTMLRGVNINFSAAVPRLQGNGQIVNNPNPIPIVPDSPDSYYMNQCGYDWGTGFTLFDLALDGGGGNYVVLFTPMIALDPAGTIWSPIPSLGTDSVSVQSPNTWKDITFKTIDFENLLDSTDPAHPVKLLYGSRRVHFKFILAAQPTAVMYTGVVRTSSSNNKK